MCWGFKVACDLPNPVRNLGKGHYFRAFPFKSIDSVYSRKLLFPSGIQPQPHVTHRNPGP